MPYSKRWELVHLLGGKCVDCGNENFYDLEIDHIHNDGDGERKYYTLSEKNYLDNPRKAKDTQDFHPHVLLHILSRHPK